MSESQSKKAVINPSITIGELKAHLDSYPDNYSLSFSGLDFFRLKQRGETRVNMEFNQQVYRDESGNVHVDNIS